IPPLSPMGREPSRDLRLPDGAGASDGGQPAFWYASMTSAGMRPRSETVYPLARAHSRIFAASPLLLERPEEEPERPRRPGARRPPTRRALPIHGARASRSLAAFFSLRSIS